MLYNVQVIQLFYKDENDLFTFYIMQQEVNKFLLLMSKN